MNTPSPTPLAGEGGRFSWTRYGSIAAVEPQSSTAQHSRLAVTILPITHVPDSPNLPGGIGLAQPADGHSRDPCC